MGDIVESSGDRDSTSAASDFASHLRMADSVAVGLDDTYVQHLQLSPDGASLASGLSNCTVSVFNTETMAKSVTLASVASEALTGLRFNPQSPQLLYTAALEGAVKLWDIRLKEASKPVRIFSSKPDAANRAKQLLCLDVNLSDSLVAAGTAQEREDTFLLFWDPRQESGKLSGGYWDSHRDDATCVAFHPETPHRLASSGTDGTVNTFDLRESTEDDAMQDCLNTESSVQNIVWYGSEGRDKLAITTHTEELLLWNPTEDSEARKTFNRDDLCAGLRRTSTNHAYIVDAFCDSEGGLSLLGGSSFAQSPCLRTLTLRKDKKLQPQSDFRVPAKMGPETRCVVRSKDGSEMYTGGEDGYVRRWKVSESENVADQLQETSLKEKTKKKSKKSAPY